MNAFKATALCGLLVAGIFSAHAQSNFSTVVSILQTHCVTGCHNSAIHEGNLDLSGTPAQVYAALVNATPDNSVAAASNQLLMEPGYPDNSFLLKKLIHALDASDTLDAGEGDVMPQTGSVAQADIEMIRQWILYGCDSVGSLINYQVVQDYYNGKGLPRIDKPAAPAPNEGFQLHLGPIIIAPQTEIEYYKKQRLPVSGQLEIHRITNFMDEASHHMILYKYKAGEDTTFGEGLRVVGFQAAADMNFAADYVSTWQYEKDHILPAGTAYRWDAGTVVDMNYHLINYNPDSVMAAEVYLNVYTEPYGTAQTEMQTALSVYGGFNPFILNVNNDGNDTTFVMEQTESAGSQINLWLIQGHTHRLGIDYDIYLRNPDGSKGDQIYEGYYDQDYTANLGYYDWEHPPVREFDPMMTIDMGNGLIHEAKYNNSGSAPVSFGLTTQDEMFITYYQYTRTTGTGVETTQKELLFRAYPNPANNMLYLDIAADNADIVISNMLGATVLKQRAFNGIQQMDISKLQPGMYLVQVTAAGKTAVKRIVVE